jgi:hypothetical protein
MTEQRVLQGARTREEKYDTFCGFEKELPNLYKRYKKGLETDYRNRTFIYGNMNPGLTKKMMFDNAMYLIIDIETSTGTNGNHVDDKEQRLISHFGPEGTYSGNVLYEMRGSVQCMFSVGYGCDSLRRLYSMESSKIRE